MAHEVQSAQSGVRNQKRALRRSSWIIAAFAIIIFVLFWVLYFIAVETAWGHRAGNAALAGRHITAPATIEFSLELLNTISVAALAIAGGALCLIGVLRGGLLLGSAIGCAMLAANVSTQLLKRVILKRPILLDEGDRFDSLNSLPSGHVTVAMSLAIGVALVAPVRWRGWLVAPATLYAVAIGIATMTAGWHRPSDVMAAYLVATFWAAIAALVLLMIRKLFRWGATRVVQPRGQEPAHNALIIISAALLAFALGTLAIETIVRSWRDLIVADVNGAFVVSVIAIGAAGVLTMSALTWSLAGLDFGANPDQ
jgi:membrane-associated phospholipid phosphatase